MSEKYLSVTEFGEKYSMDVGRIRRLISEDRIPAIKIGKQWAIPVDATPPQDMRIKSGKYIGTRKDRTKEKAES